MIPARKWLALFVVVTAFTISAQAQDSQESRLLRFPDIYKDKVAFVYGGDIWLASTSGGVARRITSHPGRELFPKFSPDGKWIAYQAAVSTRQEIFVSPFPGPGPRQQVSSDGGTEPIWSRDGHELFFQNGARLMGVRVTPGATWSSSSPQVINEGRFLRSINGNTCWTISPDGSRFLRIQMVEPERAITHVDLVLNWFSEVKQQVSRGAK